jgi:hypothetical protein
MSNSVWQTLVKSVLETEDIEIDCEECYELLDMYAEILLEGAEAEAIMPAVKQHLTQCNCCVHELEALLVIIREAAEQDNLSSATSRA